MQEQQKRINRGEINLERSEIYAQIKREMEKYRDYDKFKKCSKCELKAWCRGCPAVANGTTGDFYGADPQCWKTRNEITGEEL